MIKNYFKIALRSIAKNKIFSIVNLLGLAVGLFAVILITLYLTKELSFDRFFAESEKIVRVITSYKKAEIPSSIHTTAYETKEKMPEIKASTRAFRNGNKFLTYDNKKYGRYRRMYTDEGFFDVFSFDVLRGKPGREMQYKNRAVITRELAQEVFGDSDPIRKTIKIDEREFLVTTVIQNVPGNSHLQFDVLLSLKTLDENNYLSRVGNGFGTYFLLNQTPGEKITDKIARFVEQHVNSFYDAPENTFRVSLQPLHKIHLNSDFEYDYAVTGNRQYVLIFSFVALFILVVALFNFLNLTLARSNTRAREVGVRKVNGASARLIRWQFVTESLMVSVLAFMVAMLLLETFMPVFSEYINSKVELNYLSDFPLIAGFFVLTLLIGVIAGVYPAKHVARVNPVKIFKPDFHLLGSKRRTQTIMVVLQFVIAIALITSVTGLNRQMHYLNNKELGFDKNQVISAYSLTQKQRDNFTTLKEELAEHPAIQSVTASMAIPGSNGNGRTLRLKNQPEEEAFSANENLVQPGFVKTYGLEMVQGRDFSKNLETDKRAIIINETAAKKLGVENPVGNEVYNGGYQCKVIGVFKDCHFQSLHHKIEPFILSRRLTRNYFISVRFNPDHAEQAGNHLGKVLTDYDPGYKFQFLYLEDRMENEYARDKRSVHLIMMGTVLAIIISMMGLFALTAFHIDRKIKEIGIRKVMGASAGRITRMLLSHYLKWILLAAMIAFPLSYWFMERWFRNFAYHIQAEWWVFLFSFILAALIASVTVMFKATKAANTNPVNTLKYE